MAKRVLVQRHTAALAALLAAASLLTTAVRAEEFIAPGDTGMRIDLESLNDAGVLNIPLTAWPMSSADIASALDVIDEAALDARSRDAARRIRARLEPSGTPAGARAYGSLAGAYSPLILRGFEDTPRAEGEARAGIAWGGERVFLRLQGTLAANPADGDDVRPDGTYVGIHVGNWVASAGWQDRWYGPGRDSSLVLSTNARPPPGIMLQRRHSTPFESRWLSWIGPWTLTTFMAGLHDEREIDDAWQFGIRGSFRPLPGLEIGLSRAAIWCGDGRPCDVSTFVDLLLGNDNRGANVAAEDEPGNQLGGFDLRWRLPADIPAAVYLQWIGEDGRPGAGLVGSWLRQFGVEAWGEAGTLSHRSYVEVSDTTCREGGLGFSDVKPDCGYEHGLYRTGYRYEGRSLGHSGDSDLKSIVVGSTLLWPDGDQLGLVLRYRDINRYGTDTGRHTLSQSPQEVADILLTLDRQTRIGRLRAGIGYRHVDGAAGGALSPSEAQAYVVWNWP